MSVTDNFWTMNYTALRMMINASGCLDDDALTEYPLKTHRHHRHIIKESFVTNISHDKRRVSFNHEDWIIGKRRSIIENVQSIYHTQNIFHLNITSHATICHGSHVHCMHHFWTSLTKSSGVWSTTDSKVHGANMGPIWGRQDPGGPHVGPLILAILDCTV